MIDSQILWTLALGVYVIAVAYLTRIPYRMMVARGVESIRAVYYTRKIVHMAGAGVPTLFVPLVYTDFWYPMLGGLVVGALLFFTHASNRRLYWFQIEENQNDVSFAVMWWMSLAFLWWLLGDPWLAILPGLFMSFGDGVTGVVRNYFIRHRSKHVIGNVCVAIVSVPLAWVVASQADPALPWWGVIAALVASVVERYEFGPIDDNVLIAIASILILLAGSTLGPLG